MIAQSSASQVKTTSRNTSSAQAPSSWSSSNLLSIPSQSLGGSLVATADGKSLCAASPIPPYVPPGSHTGDVVVLNVATGERVTVPENLVAPEGDTLCVSSSSILYFSRVSSPPGKAPFTTVVAMSATTGAVIWTQNLDLPGGPFAPLTGTVDPTGRYVYFGGNGGVLVVDTQNPAAATVFPVSKAIIIYQMAVSADGLTLFMLGYPQSGSGNRQVFTAPASSPGQVALLPGIDTTSFIQGFACSPDGELLYMIRSLDAPAGNVTIDAFDLSSRTTVATLALPGPATSLAVIAPTPFGGVFALWGTVDNSSLSFVAPAANQIISIGNYETNVRQLASSSDGMQVFAGVPGVSSSQVYVYTAS